MKALTAAFATLLAVPALVASEGALAQERTVKIAGFGAKSGVVRVFGINSEAAMKAAAEEINKAGGVTLGDGSKAKLTVEFLDDRCNAEEGISVVRRIASTDAFVAVGPSCSNVAESLFGILQKKVGDASDSGLQFPIIADGAAKVGLAKICREGLRAFECNLRRHEGTGRRQRLPAARDSKWLLNDTTFSTQVRDMKRANSEIVAISAHPFTTCGVLKEMERQGVKPKLLIGLTSSSSIETLQGCAKQAEGIIIPTSFAPVTPEAKQAAENVAKFGGSADLHSAAAYELMFILKDVIEQQKIMARPDTVQADRNKMREGLAALKETNGLLGKVGRTPDREAIKPFLYVHAKDGSWQVLHKPSS
jgi:branched-chain amino acid transport system substrate-binding protein